MPTHFLRIFPIIAILILISATSRPSTTTSTAPATHPATTTTAPTSMPATMPAGAIRIGEIPTQAQAVLARLKDIHNEQTAASQTINAVENQLGPFTKELKARSDENSKLLAGNPSLDTLRHMQLTLEKSLTTLSNWKRDLTRRFGQINKELDEIAHIHSIWTATSTGAKELNPPADATQRIQSVLTSAAQTADQLIAERTRLIAIQTQISDQTAKINDMLAAVRTATHQALGQLFVKDSPPIWSSESVTSSREIADESQRSFSKQCDALKAYVSRTIERLTCDALLLIVMAWIFHWLSKKMQPWVAKEPTLKNTAAVFDKPIATAFVLLIIIARYLHPDAPRLFWAILGAAALIPAVLVMRHVMEPRVRPLLYALIVFYLFDQARNVLASLPFVTRLVFLTEMLGGLLFLIWYIRSKRINKDWHPAERVARTLRFTSRLAAIIFALALIANSLGYVSLSNMLGATLLRSSYVGLIFYSAAKIVEGLSLGLFHSYPFTLSGAVQKQRPLIQHRVARFLFWVAFFFWLWITLEMLSIRRPVVDWLHQTFTRTWTLGSVSVSLWNIVAFILTVWASFLVSRFVRFLLKEDVYPRVHLARGLPYAISTLLHYIVLVVGFILAIAALGYNMTQFTILASAFGIGLGFGMQNIVNNFVSGLIVLFERPIQVGDVIQLDDVTGDVIRIGIRASIIRSTAGSELIVPNGRLIAGNVINWTLANRLRSIHIPFTVDAAVDPNHIRDVILNVARSNQLVVQDPPPEVFAVEQAGPGLKLELHLLASKSEQWFQIRSDLITQILAEFAKQKIPLR